MSIFQLPPSRCPCKEFLISWFLPPNNLGGKKSVKFFWKCKFRVYNAVSSLGIGVRKRVTRYNWHGIKPHAVSICHFSRKAKNQLHARCPNCLMVGIGMTYRKDSKIDLARLQVTAVLWKLVVIFYENPNKSGIIREDVYNYAN